MPLSRDLLGAVTTAAVDEAWKAIAVHLWSEFSPSIAPGAAETDVVKRDKGLTELENVLSGSCWDLWSHFETAVPKASESIVGFWLSHQGGKAVLIVDGLSLRECPWLLTQAASRGYTLHEAAVRAAELPAETTPFAHALGFGQRSALANNEAGSAHKLKGAFTASCNLPWKECGSMVGAEEGIVFWHHWPDERMHHLSGPGASLQQLAKETSAALTSDDFWEFVERLTTGRKLVITSDHGYAACGHFPDLTDKDQANYMKALFKSGRSATSENQEGSWVPPIDLRLSTVHGTHRYVVGRKKWKSAAGYPTLQHGGLSLLEVFVPYIELSR